MSSYVVLKPTLQNDYNRSASGTLTYDATRGALILVFDDANDATNTDCLTLRHTTTVGTFGAANMSTGLRFQLEDGGGATEDAARVAAAWADASAASEDSTLTVQLRRAGTALAACMTVTGTGNVQSLALNLGDFVGVPDWAAFGFLSDTDTGLFRGVVPDSCSVWAGATLANGGGGIDVAVTGSFVTATDAATNTTTDALTIYHATTAVAAAGFGTGVLFQGEDDAGNTDDMGRFRWQWSVATSGAERSTLSIDARLAGAALSRMTLFSWTLGLQQTVSDAATVTTTDGLVLNHETSGAPGIAYGTGILLRGQDAAKTAGGDDMARIAAVWTDATSGSEDSDLIFQTRTASAALAEAFRANGLGLGLGGAAPTTSSQIAVATSGVAAGLSYTNSNANGSITFAGTNNVSDVLYFGIRGSTYAGTLLGVTQADAAFVFGSSCPLILGTSGADAMTVSTNNTLRMTFAALARVQMNAASFQPAQGAAVAAAASLALTIDGDGFSVTVTGVAVDFLPSATHATLPRQAGTRVTLIAAGAVTLNSGTGGAGAGFQNMLLAGSVPFVMALNSVIVLYNDGTSWQEESRKVA